MSRTCLQKLGDFQFYSDIYYIYICTNLVLCTLVPQKYIYFSISYFIILAIHYICSCFADSDDLPCGIGITTHLWFSWNIMHNHSNKSFWNKNIQITFINKKVILERVMRSSTVIKVKNFFCVFSIIRRNSIS